MSKTLQRHFQSRGDVRARSEAAFPRSSYGRIEAHTTRVFVSSGYKEAVDNYLKDSLMERLGGPGLTYFVDFVDFERPPFISRSLSPNRTPFRVEVAFEDYLNHIPVFDFWTVSSKHAPFRVEDALEDYVNHMRTLDGVTSVYYHEREDGVIDLWTIIPKINLDLERKIAKEQMELVAKYPLNFDFMVMPIRSKDVDFTLPPGMERLYPS